MFSRRRMACGHGVQSLEPWQGWLSKERGSKLSLNRMEVSVGNQNMSHLWNFQCSIFFGFRQLVEEQRPGNTLHDPDSILTSASCEGQTWAMLDSLSGGKPF